MRRNWKRILSLLLTVAMVFTMNTSVFATEPTATATGEDQQTVEAAAETTESTAAETVEETKETNSEATSETAEAPKTEETETTEEVAAEAAPAEVAETATEEAAPVEETAAEPTAETEAVVEETTEVAPAEETVAEEAAPVVEENAEAAEAETSVSAKVDASLQGKWRVTGGDDNFIGEHIQYPILDGRVVVSIDAASTKPLVLEPEADDADELVLSSNATIEVSVNGTVGTVHSVVISKNCGDITVKPTEGTDAYILDVNGDPTETTSYTKVESTGAKWTSGEEVKIVFAKAAIPTTEQEKKIITLSNNSKDPKDIKSEIKVDKDATIWGQTATTVDGDGGAENLKVSASGNITISANEDGVIKLYKATVSALAAPAKPGIGEIDEDSIYVSINSSVQGYKYRFGAVDGNGECFLSEEVGPADGGKIGTTIEELESNTTYTVSGWIIGHEIDNDGIILTDSATSDAHNAEGKTKFGIDGVIDKDTAKIYGITKTGGKFSISFNGEKFSAAIVAVSANDGITEDNVDKITTASWNEGLTSKTETNIGGFGNAPLVPGVKYDLWIAVGDDSSDFDTSVNYDYAKIGSFGTVKEYFISFEGSKASVPFRTTKNIGSIVGTPTLGFYVGGSNSPIESTDDEADIYAASANAIKSLSIAYDILSVNSTTPLKSGVTSGNNLYTTVAGTGSTYDAFKTYYKEGMSLSLNGVLDLAGIDGSEKAKGTVEVKLTNSKVVAEANPVSVYSEDHKIEYLSDISYWLEKDEEDGIQGWYNVDVNVTSANALAAFSTTNAKGPAVNMDTVYTPGNSKISIKDVNLLSWNVADDKHGSDDWAKGYSYEKGTDYANDTTGITFVASTETANFYVRPSANDSIEFSVAGTSVPYGTKNTEYNELFIEKYLIPTMTVSGTTMNYSHKNGYQYNVEYKLLSENKLEAASYNQAAAWSGFSSGLQKLDAGTKVYAYISANVVGQPKLYKNAIAELTITKRDIKLWFNGLTLYGEHDFGKNSTKNDISLSYNRLRDRSQTFADKTVSVDSADLKKAMRAQLVKDDDLFDPSIFVDEADGSGMVIVSENSIVTLAGSALDVTQAGYKAVEMTYVAAKAAKNFNVTSSKAYVYVNGGGTYYAQFYAYIDGKQVYTKKMNLKGSGGILYDVVGESDQKELMKLVTDTGSYSGSMNGLASGVDGKEVRLTGWEIIETDENGSQERIYRGYTDEDDGSWYFFEHGKKINKLYVQANHDYIITAILSKYVNGESGVYVNTIQDVEYTGQNHQSDYWSVENNSKNPKYNSASTVYDLDITVGSDDSDYYLEENVDYTVKIKNAKNASVKYDPITGEYTQLNNNAKKMPQAIITGKGKYKGFKATVYFNIRPANIGRANVTGLLDSYFWTGKKMSKKVSYKVTDTVEWKDKKGNNKWKSLKLKAYNTKKKTGDYQVVIYKAASGNAAWTKTSITDPNKISEKGNYLLTLEGMNNYTGINPVKLELTDSSADELEPKVYEVGNPLQFFVETDKSFLLDGATIKLNKGLKITDDKTYISFNQVISDVVANKKSVSADGYSAYFEYYDTYDKEWEPVDEDNDDEGDISVNAAGKYRVRVFAKEGGQYHGSQASKPFTIKGIKLSAKDLKDSIYYYYTDNSGKTVYKPYSEVKKTGISYNGGKTVFIKISGNSSVSCTDATDKYGQFYTDNGANNYASYYRDAEGYVHPKFLPGTYKVTAYGVKQYAGSKVTLSYKVAAIDLKKDTDLVGDLGSKKLIELGVYKEVSVNAGGTMPWIRISVNGMDDDWNTDDDGYETKPLSDKYTYTRPCGSGDQFKLGDHSEMIFTVNVAKNTKVGTAKVTFKGSGAVKGSITKEFSIIENKWNTKNVGNDGIIRSYDNKVWEEGALYADVQDEMNAGTKEPKYKVDLYQAYYGKYNAKKNEFTRLYKKLGSSTKEKATAYFTPDFQTVSSTSASGNTSVTMSVNFANGTKSEMSFDKGIYAYEKWNTWTDKTPNITSVVVSFNGHKNKDKKFTIPTVPTLEYTGENLYVMDKYDEKILKHKDGKVLYVNEKGEINTEKDGEPLYADDFVVKVGSTTISQNYVITSQTPDTAIKDGTVKFTVKLVKRVPESVEKYTYGGKQKVFTYKIKKASDTAL